MSIDGELVFATTESIQDYTINNAETKNGFAVGVKSFTTLKSAKGNAVAALTLGQVLRAVEDCGNTYKVKFGKSFAYIDKQMCLTGDELTQFILNNPLIFNKSLIVTSQEADLYDLETGRSVYRVFNGEELSFVGEDASSYKVILPEGTNYLTGEDTFASIDKKYVKCVFRIHITDFSKDTYVIEDEIEVQKMNDIVSYACSFVGNPYVWGGTDPHTGADCSGFTQYVYKHFGYNIPRCSYEQADYGKTVPFSDLRPGDLIFYTYSDGNIHHVTMYIGGGKVVQARGRAYGICITDWNVGNPAWAKRIM